jgi:hypothetical protein
MPNLSLFNSLLIKKSKSKSTATKKPGKIGQPNKQQQSIKLHIELPFYPGGEHCYKDYDNQCGYNSEYETTISTNDPIDRNSNGKQLISLHISIDNRVFTPRTQTNSRSKPNSDAISTTGTMTSGYSSGSDNDKNEHIYDTLKYLNTPSMAAKRRHSLSSSSSLSSTSTMITISPTKQTSQPGNFKAKPSSDYEEISNFSQITTETSILRGETENNSPSYLYQTLYNCKSSSIKRIRTLNCARKTTTINAHNIRKHDYSVNEIFKNLEEFEKDAREQENLISKRFRPQAPPHNYVNDRISKV